MMLPGFNTALQPTSAPSPSSAREFAQAGVERFAVYFHSDVAGEQFEVGNFYTRAEVRLVSQNRIADVVKMRRGGVVEQKRIFNLRRIAATTQLSPDDDILADVGVVANLAISCRSMAGHFDVMAPSSTNSPLRRYA